MILALMPFIIEETLDLETLICFSKGVILWFCLWELWDDKSVKSYFLSYGQDKRDLGASPKAWCTFLMLFFLDNDSPESHSTGYISGALEWFYFE